MRMARTASHLRDLRSSGTGSSCRRASALRAEKCGGARGGGAAAGEGRRGVSGGAGEGARTRSNGRFTRVVNRKAASPSSATPRGSMVYPRGGAHERVELLAARGQRLRARGERVERRGAQQQGSSVRRPQRRGDGGARCERCCPMHLSFRNQSPECCNSLGVLLCCTAKRHDAGLQAHGLLVSYMPLARGIVRSVSNFSTTQVPCPKGLTRDVDCPCRKPRGIC